MVVILKKEEQIVLIETSENVSMKIESRMIIMYCIYSDQ